LRKRACVIPTSKPLLTCVMSFAKVADLDK
jgi:hypothetical protein